MGGLCSSISNENKLYKVNINGTNVLFHIDKTNFIGTFCSHNESTEDYNIYYTFVIIKHMNKEYLLLNKRADFQKLCDFIVYQYDGSIMGVLLFKKTTYDGDNIHLIISKDHKKLYYTDIEIPIEHQYLHKLVKK